MTATHPIPDNPSLTNGIPTYQDFIKRDTTKAPADLLEVHTLDLGVAPLAAERYTSSSFHRQELERMWPRVWQLACREEEIPEVGDTLVYELCDYSFLIIRTESGDIKAFYNSCPHRGTKLCQADTSLRQVRCPYHGFTWSLDGNLLGVPCQWDFPQINNKDHRLGQVKTSLWGGFVFINMDDNAQPLEKYLEILPSHFIGQNDYSQKYMSAYYRKILPANWKAAQEAFLEGFHLLETHPQMLPFAPHTQYQYDVFPGSLHTNRFLGLMAVPSEHLRHLSEQEILNALYQEMTGAPGNAPKLAPGMTAREFMANAARMKQTQETGRDYSMSSEAEALDGLQYFLFPNMILFRGFGFPMVYRFRPNGHDPDSCIFDMIRIRDVPRDGVRPVAARPLNLGEQSYRDLAPAFPSWIGTIYDQDTQNLGAQQAGMKARPGAMLALSRYQESRIRHMHATLDLYLSADSTLRSDPRDQSRTRPD